MLQPVKLAAVFGVIALALYLGRGPANQPDVAALRPAASKPAFVSSSEVSRRLSALEPAQRMSVTAGLEKPERLAPAQTVGSAPAGDRRGRPPDKRVARDLLRAPAPASSPDTAAVLARESRAFVREPMLASAPPFNEVRIEVDLSSGLEAVRDSHLEGPASGTSSASLSDREDNEVPFHFLVGRAKQEARKPTRLTTAIATRQTATTFGSPESPPARQLLLSQWRNLQSDPLRVPVVRRLLGPRSPEVVN